MASRAQLERWADEAARAEGVDPRLFRALIQAESGWRVDARSPVGATGLTQLMPATGRSLGVTNPLDPRQNLRGGAKYIGQQLRAFKGDPRLALAAYNAGPGAVSKYGGIPPFRETQNYVAKIMGSLGSTPISAPQAPAAGGGGLPAAGGAPTGAALSGSPMEMISALRSLRGGDAPIRARGFNATSGITRLAGLQMLKSAMTARPAPSAPGVPAGGTEIQPAINLGGGVAVVPSGGWAGTQGPVESLTKIALRHGLRVSSGKRDRRSTASGGVSDHWSGSTNAFAHDLAWGGARPIPASDRAASAIVRHLGGPANWGQTGGNFVTQRNGIRWQVIYRSDVGGNHWDHIHLGARRL